MYFYIIMVRVYLFQYNSSPKYGFAFIKIATRPH